MGNLSVEVRSRIEKLIDKDHQIGHSYLLEAESLEELADVFQDKIIPLLEEYFYGDFGKIGLVLGEKFVDLKNNGDKDFKFAKFESIDRDIIVDLAERKVFQVSDPSTWDAPTFISIYRD